MALDIHRFRVAAWRCSSLRSTTCLRYLPNLSKHTDGLMIPIPISQHNFVRITNFAKGFWQNYSKFFQTDIWLYFLFLNLVCVYNSCLKTRTCFLLNILHLAWNNTIQHLRSQFLRPELSMAKLWQGSGGGLHPLVEAYTVPGPDGPWWGPGWADFCRISGWFLGRLAFARKSVTSNRVGIRVALCRISALKITRPTRPSYWKWEVLFSFFWYM